MHSAQPDDSKPDQTPESPLTNLHKEQTKTNVLGAQDTQSSPGNETRFPVTFTGTGGEYFRIWIVNIMLSIVTLYVYSAWAKVRNERYFAGNTIVDDSAFEYHATGMQIFIGRIVALLLLGVAVILGILSPFAELAIGLVAVVVLPWIVWRSLKFNLRMKSYRNVRFGFSGKLSGAYLTLLVWPLAPLSICALIAAAAYFLLASNEIAAIAMVLGVLITFFMFPLVQQKIASYFLNGARFGQAKCTGTPSPKRYYGIYLKALGLSILIPLALTAMIAAVIGLLGMPSPDSLEEIVEGLKDNDAAVAIVPIAIVYLAMIVGGFLIKTYVSVRIREHLLSQTKLDTKVGFESTMRVIPLTWLLISNMLLLVVTLGLATPWTKIRLARYEAKNTFLHSANGLYAVVAAEHTHQNSLGEELGEAFDMNVDIGI